MLDAPLAAELDAGAVEAGAAAGAVVGAAAAGASTGCARFAAGRDPAGGDEIDGADEQADRSKASARITAVTFHPTRPERQATRGE